MRRRVVRAVVMREFGPPEVLEPAEVDEVRAGPGEVVIEAEFANVTFVETQIRAGRAPHPSMLPALPVILGNGTGGTVAGRRGGGRRRGAADRGPGRAVAAGRGGTAGRRPHRAQPGEPGRAGGGRDRAGRGGGGRRGDAARAAGPAGWRAGGGAGRAAGQARPGP